MRTKEAEKLVLQRFMQDQSGNNSVYFYSVVNPLRNKEARIDTYACRLTSRSRKPMVKCIQRYYTNKTEMDVRDLFYSHMGGYKVDFSDISWDCIHYAERYYTEESLKKCPVGTWDTMKYEGWAKTKFLMYGVFVNDFEGTKYEHSGIEHSRMHPMRFFECYKISKSVEFLVKNGMGRFCTPAFVTRLRDNREFFNYFRMHAKEIQENWIGLRELNIMFAHKCSFAEAQERCEASEAFKNQSWCRNIPKSINRYELYKWCKKNRVEVNEYRRYVNYIYNIGEDICAFGVTYPRNFRNALEIAEAASHKVDERRRREELRALRKSAAERRKLERKENEDITQAMAEIAKKLAVMNGITGYGYAVVVPASAKALIREGNAMRNCIGKCGYGRKVANGESLIFFLRGIDGRKNVDVEVRLFKSGKKMRFEVAQCYEKHNQQAPEPAVQFARELAAKAVSILFGKKARKAA